jgi:serine/threonine-protein kinase
VAEQSLVLFSDADADRVINAFVTPRDGGEVYACAEGCELLEDDSVELYVSAGAFPDVAGMSVDQATKTLSDKQLQVSGDIQYVTSEDVEKDRVIGVADRAEEGNWRPGDQVQLIVSTGPPLFPVPDVTGMSRDEAAQAIRDAGFEPTWNGIWNAFPNDFTEVTGSDPGEGEQRRKGTKITLQIRSSAF